MFELTQAVDKGNMVVYTEAFDEVLAKQRLRKRRAAITKVDQEAPVQGMRLIYK